MYIYIYTHTHTYIHSRTYSVFTHMYVETTPQTPTVWQSIGFPNPAQAAQGIMQQSDDFGYKAPVQSLLQCGHGGPCPIVPQINIVSNPQSCHVTSRHVVTPSPTA